MPKRFFWTIVAVTAMLFLITGCSSNTSAETAASSSAKEASSSSSGSAESSSSTPDSSFEPITLVDDDKVLIRVDGQASDPGYIENYGYVLYLENKTDSKVKFIYEDGSFSVDGAMMTPKFNHDVMPGKHDNSGYLVFIAEDGITGFDDLKNVEGVIQLRNPESFELLASYPVAIDGDSSPESQAEVEKPEEPENSTAPESASSSSSSATSTNVTPTMPTTTTNTPQQTTTTKEVTDENLQGMLLANAQSVVKDHLKSPSSAKFPWSFSEYKFIDEGSSSKHSGYHTYKIQGPVEAENAYGALLKGTFTVEIDYFLDSENYYEISCNIDS